MKQRYQKISHELAFLAVSKCLEDKWRRNDVLTYIEEWTGHSRYELYADEIKNHNLSFRIKYEIIQELAASAEDMVDGITHGIDPDFDPVLTRLKADGASGKVRKIAYLCVRHQILGHIVHKGLEPLLTARILPTQHASIPERGQTGLARQVKRMLNRKLGIRYFVKTDCTGAYASVQYSVVMDLLRKEIPRAKWIFACMKVLEKYAPGGHLIIGGYLDAWLFNYVMSYALRHVLSLKKSRRGNEIPLVIRAVTFMDDALLMGSAKASLIRAVKLLTEWLWATFHIRLRTTADVLEVNSIAEEKARKHERASRRTVHMIDMGGYKISRGHITIRRRNLPRIRRCFLRAWREYQETGTLKRQRACQIIARNGMLQCSNSFQFCQKYHVYQLLRVAKAVQAYWARAEARRRKERLSHVLRKHQKQCDAICGHC